MPSTVPYRTNSYGFYLSNICALIGVDQGDLQTTELTFLNVFFNRAFRKIWEMQIWTDLCPRGEARFPTGLLADPNFITGTSNAQFTNVTVGTVANPNPLDNRSTASSFLETSATGQHSVNPFLANLATATGIPGAAYAFTGYARPNGRNWLSVVLQDGAGNSLTVFFNFVNPSPVVGTTTASGFTNLTTAIQQVGNGFFKWSIGFQSASNTTGFGSPSLQFSTDGSTTSYAGNTSLGMFLWGITFYLTQNLVPESYYIPFSQLGESAIDSVFEVWGSDPNNALIPSRVTYTLNPYGIQPVGYCPPGALWVYYRPQRPAFSGSQWSASATYTAGEGMYYTTTAGTLNYYTAIVATTAGQSPDTTPASWQVLFIPDLLFQYIVHNAYADWLQTEGQTAKASMMYEYAQTCVDDENDRQERQNGNIQPWRVSTHITSQNRGIGYNSLTYNPNANALLS